jgi:hypothetical protein
VLCAQVRERRSNELMFSVCGVCECAIVVNRGRGGLRNYVDGEMESMAIVVSTGSGGLYHRHCSQASSVSRAGRGETALCQTLSPAPRASLSREALNVPVASMKHHRAQRTTSAMDRRLQPLSEPATYRHSAANRSPFPGIESTRVCSCLDDLPLAAAS